MKLFLHLLAVALAGPAFAHATFEQTEFAQNSTAKFTTRIGHGCEGEATLRVRVQIPEGVIAVKPMPKAGWTLETVSGPYGRSYELWGATVTEVSLCLLIIDFDQATLTETLPWGRRALRTNDQRPRHKAPPPRPALPRRRRPRDGMRDGTGRYATARHSRGKAAGPGAKAPLASPETGLDDT